MKRDPNARKIIYYCFYATINFNFTEFAEILRVWLVYLNDDFSTELIRRKEETQGHEGISLCFGQQVVLTIVSVDI